MKYKEHKESYYEYLKRINDLLDLKYHFIPNLKHNDTIAWFVAHGYNEADILEHADIPRTIVKEWFHAINLELPKINQK